MLKVKTKIHTSNIKFILQSYRSFCTYTLYLHVRIKMKIQFSLWSQDIVSKTIEVIAAHSTVLFLQSYGLFSSEKSTATLRHAHIPRTIWLYSKRILPFTLYTGQSNTKFEFPGNTRETSTKRRLTNDGALSANNTIE